jgi:hypothetical protein
VPSYHPLSTVIISAIVVFLVSVLCGLTGLAFVEVTGMPEKKSACSEKDRLKVVTLLSCVGKEVIASLTTRQCDLQEMHITEN